MTLVTRKSGYYCSKNCEVVTHCLNDIINDKLIIELCDMCMFLEMLEAS